MLEIIANNHKLYIASGGEIASAAVNTPMFAIKLSDEWRDFDVTAQFIGCGKTVHVAAIESGRQYPIPWECIEYKGRMTVSLKGVSGDTVKTALPITVTVKDSTITKGSEPQAPTPSAYEQYVNRINEIVAETFNEAEHTSNKASSMLEACNDSKYPSVNAVKDYVNRYMIDSLSDEMHGRHVSGIATPSAVVDYVTAKAEKLPNTMDVEYLINENFSSRQYHDMSQELIDFDPDGIYVSAGAIAKYVNGKVEKLPKFDQIPPSIVVKTKRSKAVTVYDSSDKSLNSLTLYGSAQTVTSPKITLTDAKLNNEQSVTLSDIVLGEGDTVTLANGKVEACINGVTTDITASYSAQGLLTLHTYYLGTTVMSDCEFELGYIADTKGYIDAMTSAVAPTWANIQKAVRAGLGEKIFPVGYEFKTYDAESNTNIVWVVRGHDCHSAANDKLKHSMTLEAKYVYSQTNGSYKGLQFDAIEAMYYAADGLAAGTYNFTVANQAWYTADNGKVFQFTLTQAVPAGGQIALSMTYNATLEGKSVNTYANPSSTAAIETATISEGSAGTNLGTTDGSGNMNYMHRIVFGSNNYAQSAARQWLNSAAAAGAVWVPTNIFDRPPSWATSYNGFMHGLPDDFLAVVQPAVIPCRTNGVYECNSLDGTAFTINQVYSLEDKFFLLSRPEIYGSWDSTAYKDGELLEYYDGLTNAERKKFDVAGSVRHAWLRSPTPSIAHGERLVGTDGSVYDSGAYGGYGVAPACIIA